jgi:hypothetical protein
VLQSDTPGVRVSLDRISGTLREPKALGSQLEIVRADGRVRGNVVHVLDLDLQGRLDGGRLDAHLAYFNRDKTPVELELRPEGGLKAKLAATGTLLRSWFTETLEVRVH